MAQVNEGNSQTSPDVAAGQRVAEGQRVVKVATADAIRNQKPKADVSQSADPPMDYLAPPVVPPPPPPEADN